jgi:hypothetical protein
MRPLPVRPKPLLALGALAVVFALAAPAAAQQTPTLGAPETQTTTTVPPDTSTTTGNGGLRPWQEVLIFAAGLVLIAGIAIAILGDARERASRLRHGGTGPEDDATRHRRSQQAKQRARAKARAAKAQRRRNRAR